MAKIFRYILMLMAMVVCSKPVLAQRIGVAMDAPGVLNLSPNLSTEITLTAKTSLKFSLSFDTNVGLKNYNYHNFSTSFEYRYWFKQAFYSHFVGANIVYGKYSLTLPTYSYQSNIIALGVTYGYSFMLTPRWNIIPSIGLGGGYGVNYWTYKKGIIPAITDFGIRIQYIIK